MSLTYGCRLWGPQGPMCTLSISCLLPVDSRPLGGHNIRVRAYGEFDGNLTRNKRKERGLLRLKIEFTSARIKVCDFETLLEKVYAGYKARSLYAVLVKVVRMSTTKMLTK